MKLPGVLIVIEGSDGSGKGTQFNLLNERLKAAGYDVAVFDFPRYENESSYFVRQYLNGNFGPAAEISPFTASLFYALDRYEAAKEIRAELAAGKVVLCNRYVGSNMAHQGAKFGPVGMGALGFVPLRDACGAFDVSGDENFHGWVPLSVKSGRAG